MGEFVNLNIDESNGVGTIRLDRPPMNAINEQLASELEIAAREATRDDRVKAVVVSGGDKIFAAGADIKEMAEANPVQMMSRIGGLQAVFTQVEDIPKVVIAAINGFALGGGCELSLACDFRVLADNAKIGQPAKDIVFSGRFLDCNEALAIGLVDVVVPAGDTYAKAVEIAARYARGPLVALRAAKIAINRGLQVDLSNGMLIEREVFVNLFATEDQKIGMRTFIEKGPGKADFVGR
ncbi:MAG: enoyl-CoA hydratase/isomerase family protein [Actinobacteria bacterium]|nr:MAG: enoyl-CoA hydratase/isomerase family protein [Actinomycetota bacterium]